MQLIKYKAENFLIAHFAGGEIRPTAVMAMSCLMCISVIIRSKNNYN